MCCSTASSKALSKNGTFVGQHIYTPLQGAAVHINAFNFPVWGMLEKLAPTLLAGVPAIVKPASATAYLTEAAFRIMIEADVLPPGAIQLIVGGVGDLFDHLTGQDIVSFTGSASTALKLRTHPDGHARIGPLRRRAGQPQRLAARPRRRAGHARVRPVHQGSRDRDDGQGGAEVHRHPPRHGAGRNISTRSSRRSRERLAKTKVGDPRAEDTRMGALVSVSQRDDVREQIARARSRRRADRRRRSRTPSRRSPGGAFLPPVLLRTDDPWGTDAVHDVEPFGPVSTIMPYKDIGDAIALANRGKGSLALSLFTHSPDAAREFVQGAAAYHGRMLVIDRTNAAESTGHGSPLPVLVHGGPGRAGGSEEMGGVRGVKHYMQRTAIQSSPAMIAAITEQYIPGAPKHVIDVHPFRLKMSELHIGDTWKTGEPHRHARGHRAFRRVHRRQILRPHGRGSGQGLADLRGPRRPRLSDPELRRRPVRRSRSRARCWPIPASRICAS